MSWIQSNQLNPETKDFLNIMMGDENRVMIVLNIMKGDQDRVEENYPKLSHPVTYIDKMLVLKNLEFAGFSVIIYNFIRFKHFTHLL